MTTNDYIKFIKEHNLLCLIWHPHDCPLIEVQELTEIKEMEGEWTIEREGEIKKMRIYYIVLHSRNAEDICHRLAHDEIKTFDLKNGFVIDILLAVEDFLDEFNGF